MTDLNARLLAAHAAGDKHTLVDLYAEAANTAPDTDTACFFLTQAYVFALEIAHPATAGLKAELAKHGRI